MTKFAFLPDTRNFLKICDYKTDLLFIKKWLTFFSWLGSYLEMIKFQSGPSFPGGWGEVAKCYQGGLITPRVSKMAAEHG